MNEIADKWELLFKNLTAKSSGHSFNEYLPLNKDQFITGYEISDLNYSFTVTVEGDKIFFNRDAFGISDISIRLSAELFSKILNDQQNLFQAVVENRLDVSGNSQYLTYLTSKNPIIDIIKECSLQQDLNSLLNSDGVA